MEYSVNQIQDGHIHLEPIKKNTKYTVSMRHDGPAYFLIEVLNNANSFIYRPTKFYTTALPNVPYSLSFSSPVNGMLAIHYLDRFETRDLKWTRVYDISVEEA